MDHFAAVILLMICILCCSIKGTDTTPQPPPPNNGNHTGTPPPTGQSPHKTSGVNMGGGRNNHMTMPSGRLPGSDMNTHSGKNMENTTPDKRKQSGQKCDGSDDCKKGDKLQIVAIVLCCVVLVVVTAVGGICFFQWYRKRQRRVPFESMNNPFPNLSTQNVTYDIYPTKD